jgi:hypothetical protein
LARDAELVNAAETDRLMRAMADGNNDGIDAAAEVSVFPTTSDIHEVHRKLMVNSDTVRFIAYCSTSHDPKRHQ